MDYSCGIGPFHPQWLQRFANTKCFIVIYSLLGTVQGMSYIYTSATLTTLEKRFKIPSKTIGILMSGNEVSQVFLSLYMSYHGGKGNRPLWISWGVTFSAVSCYVLALPHFIYGPGKEALSLTEEYLDISLLNSSHQLQDSKHLSLLCSSNRTDVSARCEEKALFSGDTSLMPLILIFFSQFILGIGTTLFHSLGQTYLDDHTKKTSAPIMLGLVMSLRMVGPAAGFAFSSFCLSLYIDPSLTPVIGTKDPRWLGAWWLGWIVLGSLMLVFAFLIAWFPGELPSKEKNNSRRYRSTVTNKVHKEEEALTSINSNSDLHQREVKNRIHNTVTPETQRKKQIKDDEGFLVSLKRLMANKLLLYNIFAGVFYIMGSSGSMTFSMKYMETQYHTSAAGASMISGSASVLAMVFGFLTSGYLIGKFKPQPRFVLGWNVILGSVSVIGSIIYIFLGCDDNGLQGLDFQTGKLDILNNCNSNCSCTNVKYEPVCYIDEDITFYSACHIGCHSEVHSLSASSLFTNCTCIPLHSNRRMERRETSYIQKPQSYLQDLNVVVGNGPCPVDCTGILYTYVLVTFVINTLGSSGRIGNILVNFRCVKQKDKVFAQGLSLLIVSLFAFIPGPIIFGAIIDMTCLLWDNRCGSKGNCWYYHKDKFRIYMNFTAAVLTSIGILLDAKVWYLGKSLNLYGETEESFSERKSEQSSIRDENIKFK